MSDDLHQLVAPELSIVTDFPNVERGSVAEMNAICDILESLSLGLQLPSRAKEGEAYIMGYHEKKMFRIESGGGLLITPFTVKDDSIEEGYIYQTPGVAVSWLLCKLGHGTNASNFEADTITFKSGPSQPAVRIAFEKPLNQMQRSFYESLGSYGFREGNLESSNFGTNLLDKIKTPN